jgi:hypothetical protein
MRTIIYWEREVDEWLAQLREIRELHEGPPCSHELQSARLHLDDEQHLVANYVCDRCHRILGRVPDSYLDGASLTEPRLFPETPPPTRRGWLHGSAFRNTYKRPNSSPFITTRSFK